MTSLKGRIRQGAALFRGRIHRGSLPQMMVRNALADSARSANIWIVMHPLRLLLTSVLSAAVLAADVPPEIPAETFFKDPTYRSVQLSPSGRYLAAISSAANGTPNIVCIDLATRQANAVTSFKDGLEVDSFVWKTDDLLLWGADTDGNQIASLNAVDRQGTKNNVLVPPLPPGNYVYRFTSIFDLLPEDPENILVLSNRNNLDSPSLFTLNVKNGQVRLHTANPGEAQSYILDRQQVARFTTDLREDGSLSVHLWRPSADAEWKELARFRRSDRSWKAVAFAEDNRRLIVASNLKTNTAELYYYDPETREFGERIYGNENFDVTGLIEMPYSRRIMGVSYVAEKPKAVWFDKDMRAWQKALDDAMPETINNFTSFNAKEDLAVVYSYSDRDRGTYRLMDLKTGEMEIFARAAEWLDPAQMAETRPVKIKTRDSYELLGYATFPKGRGEKNLPMILYPHGGPWARDVWGFEYDAQFLANRGFLVVQVNFRGSEGFGFDHLMAGKRTWETTMRHDLVDTVKWAIEQGYADPSRVGVYGASYGGYATMSQLVFEPQLYTFGINYVGVVDVPEQVRWWGKTGRKWGTEYWREMVGDERKEKERLESFSPINFIDRLNVPLFVIHGETDPQVSVEQSYMLINELKRKRKTFKQLIVKGEGHGFVKEENRIRLYTMMDEFLAPFKGPPRS